MTDRHLLLDLTYRGQVLRVATAAVDVYDADTATWLAYTAGIDALTVSLALDFLASAGALSVPVECILPTDTNPGAALAGCAATLSIWTDGDDYADRQILASGVVIDPVWGEDGEAVSFSISRPATTSTALAIPATQRVDDTTWPDSMAAMSPADKGQAYPTVFGSPGWGSDPVTGSQGVWIDMDNLFWGLAIAGQQVTGAYVYLVTDVVPNGLPFRVSHRLDARGQIVAFVDAYADGYPTRTNTHLNPPGPTRYYGIGDAAAVAFQALMATPIPVFVQWSQSSVDATTPAGLSPLAGDVIAYMLARAGSPVDTGRFAAALPLLTGYRFDCVIDDGATKALEWLQTNVYPLLPMSIASGPDGDYPIVWRYDAASSDATAHLDADADPMISRAGKAKSDAGKLANAFSIQYRYSVRTGSYTATLTRDKATCPYCAASERANGRIEKAITTVNVYDAPTASAMLAWMARAYTSPTVRVPYLVPSGYRLRRGQVVTLTDSRMSYAAQLCLVSDVQIDGTGVDGVELLIIPDPLRDR